MEKNTASACSSEATSSKSALTARIVSGSFGSIITSLVVTPLEVVKVRMQANTEFAASVAASPSPRPSNVIPCPRGCGTFVFFNGHLDCVLPKSSVPFFNKATGKLASPLPPAQRNLGTLAMVRRIFANEGFAGIYAGLRPTLVMAVPNTVLYFSAYEEIVWRLRNTAGYGGSGNNSWYFPLAAGASARLVSSTVTAPFEFIRTRQAAEVGENKVALGLWQEFRTIVSNEGTLTLYRGLRPTLWRDVPFSAIYWLCLERFRLYWRSLSETPSPLEQAGEAFINGAAAGMIAAACTTPFDVIKTLQQVSNESSSATEVSSVSLEHCKHNGALAYQAPSRRSTSTFHLLRQVARKEGLSGLWRGNQARMLKVAPGCAIMISSYEFGKRVLE